MTSTQVRSVGNGGQYIPDTQIPTDITWDTLPSHTNKMLDTLVTYTFDGAAASSSDLPMQFVAEDGGIIKGILYANGAVAADGSSGWELSFINKSNSDDVLAYFGIGSGTEAAKATDVDTAVAAHGFAEIANSDTSRFNKGDVIRCDADRDGTTIVGTFHLLVEYTGIGRS